jgi:hypothetical protein
MRYAGSRASYGTKGVKLPYLGNVPYVPRGASYPTEHALLPYLQRYTRKETLRNVILIELVTLDVSRSIQELIRSPYGDVGTLTRVSILDNVHNIALSYPCSPDVGTARHGSNFDKLCQRT